MENLTGLIKARIPDHNTQKMRTIASKPGKLEKRFRLRHYHAALCWDMKMTGGLLKI